MKYCKKCGNEVDGSHSYCFSCGATIEVEETKDEFAYGDAQETQKEVKYCDTCGNEIDDSEPYCFHCGAAIESNEQSDGVAGDFWWGVLGFILPLLGLILYFVWREDKPERGKSIIVGSVIGLVLNAVILN